MDRKKLLDEIQNYLDRFKELSINSFQCGYVTAEVLNPYFNFKDYTERHYTNGYGVRSAWMAGGSERILVEIQPNGWRGDEQRINTEQMTLKQLEGVHQLVKTLYENRLKEIERTQANPKLETLLPDIKGFAERCQKAVGELYSIELSKGRRQYDRQDYHALVIEKEGWQIGSVPLRQKNDGMLTYNVQKPLGGEYAKDMEFMPDNWQLKIKEALEEIIGGRIYLEMADTPISKVKVDVNYRDEYYISCRINGVQQLRKKLLDKDKSSYLSVKWNSTPYYLEVEKRQLAEKYYKTEIELACDRSKFHGIGR